MPLWPCPSSRSTRETSVIRAPSSLGGFELDIKIDMKRISVTVLDSDYERFRHAAQAQGRPIAQLIRDAMALYRREHLERRVALRDVPVPVGHRLVAGLPDRGEIYDEACDGILASGER